MAFKDRLQPANYAERIAMARRMRDELQLEIPILVDGMDDESRAVFGDLPSPAIVIDPGQVVRIKLPWAEPEVLGPRLEALLEDPIAGITPTSPWDQQMGAALSLLRRGRVGEATARLEEIVRTSPRIELDLGPPDSTPVPEHLAPRVAICEAYRLARALDRDPRSQPDLQALKALLAKSGKDAPWQPWAHRVLEEADEK